MSLNKLQLLLKNVIESRLDIEFGKSNATVQPVPEIEMEASELTRFIQEHNLSNREVVTLLLALVPHVSPEFLNSIISVYLPNGGDFPAFGGVKGKNHRGILPTGETVLYILAGHDVEQRVELAKMFSEDHFFARKGLLYLEEVPAGEPQLSGRLIIEQEFVDLFTSGVASKPRLSSDFPAQLIETGLEWKDLILNAKTTSQIAEIETWLKYNDSLFEEWGMKNRIKPGFRVLFSGPPGTGKTLTASLLGKYTGRNVFRIDLSLVISKYIGETEKNLSKLFDRAKNKNWILFFDEADAIFGKRTGIRDAHDKYANQEVSYLLQRIETHAGLVILASNMKNNIDPAFTRRFNSIVEFENPTTQERLLIWKNNIPFKMKLDERINLEEISGKFEVNGANIVNIIHYASLKTLENGLDTISLADLLKGIQKEYDKEGKMINLNL
ncbi:MAG TPA: AAA family ATPase [Prolixibacteraceae bacterium]|nr:AAA family ATPase [Prolixibacteraceae bacterium]